MAEPNGGNPATGDGQASGETAQTSATTQTNGNGNGHSSSNGSSPERSGMKRDLETDASKLMKESGLEAVEPIMPRNTNPGDRGVIVPVEANVFLLKRAPGTMTVYVNDISIIGEATNRTVEFSKKGREDWIVNDRKEKCVKVITKLHQKFPETFFDLYKSFYDGQSMLYTLYDIFADGRQTKVFNLECGELGDEDLATFQMVKVEVKKSLNASFEYSPEEITQKTADLDLSKNNRELVHFLEVVCNEYAIMNPQRHKVFEAGKTYLVNLLNEGLQPGDIKTVGDGKTLFVGAQKSIRQVEGPAGRGFNNPSIVIDAKKAPFHDVMDLATKALAVLHHSMDQVFRNGEREKLLGVIKGLYVDTTYLTKPKRLQVYSLSNKGASTSMFDRNGQSVSVASYFEDKYNIELKFPDAPLVICRERGQPNCYPMELLRICPMQRVTLSQMTSDQSRLSTKECAVGPTDRQAYIMKTAHALELFNQNNAYLKNVGLEVVSNPVTCDARTLQGPSLIYSHGTKVQGTDGRWQIRPNVKYINPVDIAQWTMLCFQDPKQSRYTNNDMRMFAESYMKEARKRGIQINMPDFAFAETAQIGEQLGVAKEKGHIFVLAIIGDGFTAAHHTLKYYEREHQIVTQQIQMSNVTKIMIDNKFLTLENIVHKTNIKLGGLNYSIDCSANNGLSQKWFSDERLYIGIWLATAPPRAAFDDVKDPLVVGFAANMLPNNSEIVGDFLLQEDTQREYFVGIFEVVEMCILRHKFAHKKPCKEIIIYRSNIDEGGYAALLTKEIPLVKAVLVKLKMTDVKVVYIVASKTHHLRLFKRTIDRLAKPSFQNIPAGIVVDTVVTHPAYKEFYLNSHTTLQGSAKTPKYTILCDDLQESMNEIEGATYALCYNHQIVNLTTSLPSPLYIAMRYAERGRNMYNEERHHEEALRQAKGDAEEKERPARNGFDRMARKLCYRTSGDLANKRINA